LSIYIPSPYPPVPSLKKRESPNNGHHQVSFGGDKKKSNAKNVPKSPDLKEIFSATGDIATGDI